MITGDVTRTLRIVAASLVISLCLPAHAADKAAAESLFNAGKELMDAGQYAEACLKFGESHDAEPSVGALLNLALCNQKLGKTASAWAHYREAAVIAGRLNDGERRRGAEQLAAELEGKLSKLTVDVSVRHDGMTVHRNGEPVSALGSPLPVDPGTYQISASAPGRAPWSTNVTIGANAAQETVLVPELSADDAGALATPDDGGTAWQTVAGWTLVGVGAVGLGVGISFGIVAIGKRDELDRTCPNKVCPPDNSLLGEAETAATVSTIGIVIGGAAAIGGVVLLLVAPSGADDGEWALAPWAGPQAAGLTLGGRF
jgi:hypothetical protein